jgi:hypothetical protein
MKADRGSVYAGRQASIEQGRRKFGPSPESGSGLARGSNLLPGLEELIDQADGIRLLIKRDSLTA